MWTKLDDKFHSHAKVYAVGNEGAGLYCRALSYCGDHLTDGFVPAGWVETIASPKLIERLVAAKLWRVADGGYFIDGYVALNPSKHELEARREARREGGKLGAERRWGDRSTHGSTHRSPIGAAKAEPSLTHVRRHAPEPEPEPEPEGSSPPAPSVARENGRAGDDLTRLGDVIPDVMPRKPDGVDDDIPFDEVHAATGRGARVTTLRQFAAREVAP